jgi:hypothetical protein
MVARESLELLVRVRISEGQMGARQINVWDIMVEFLLEEGYIYVASSRSMMPYKSWIEIDIDTIQLWTNKGNSIWISFQDHKLNINHEIMFEKFHDLINISLYDPEAFLLFKKVLDEL